MPSRSEYYANIALAARVAQAAPALYQYPKPATPAQVAGRTAYDADVRARYFAMQREA